MLKINPQQLIRLYFHQGMHVCERARWLASALHRKRTESCGRRRWESEEIKEEKGGATMERSKREETRTEEERREDISGIA